MRLGAPERALGAAQDPAAELARARVQLHYLVHDCFLEPEELVSSLTHLAQTRVLIVQGKRDRVCPPRTALELAKRLPHAELCLVERGGHSAAEPAMAQALRSAADELRGRL
jgi:proline iminopeptidase